MINGITARTLALVAGGSYWIIFVAAIFANFYMLESLTADPLTTFCSSLRSSIRSGCW